MALGIVITVALIILAVIFIGYFVTVFNGLIQLKHNIGKSSANIDVLLKQRADELPKLIDTVKGYKKYEKDVLEKITAARTAVMKADSMSKKAAASDQLSSAFKSLFAVAENYPKLQASESFQQLQNRISMLEEQLADRREFYNDSVNNYNIRIHSIPDFVVANMMGYKEEPLFKATAKDRKDVKIDL